jgi:uncharacterized protein
MRLTESQQEAIRNTALEIFGSGCRLFLFGSRVDDSKKGGDIDLFIETKEDSATAFKKKLLFLVRLKQRIGDRKIDLVVKGEDSTSKPIYRLARKKGIELV